MWYFSWILGLGFAVGCGVLNGMWHEFHLPIEDDADGRDECCGSIGSDNPGAQRGAANTTRNAAVIVSGGHDIIPMSFGPE